MLHKTNEKSSLMNGYDQSIEIAKRIIGENRNINDRILNLIQEGFHIGYANENHYKVKDLIYHLELKCRLIKVASKRSSYRDYTTEKPYAFLVKNEELRRLKLKKIVKSLNEK
nr:hypothetical protein [uncultured Carboxylicivirga sp.]